MSNNPGGRPSILGVLASLIIAGGAITAPFIAISFSASPAKLPVTSGAPPVSAVTFDDPAFGRAVKDYLMENPETIMVAVDVFRERQQVEQERRAKEALSQNWELLEHDGFSYVGGNPEGDVTIVEFLDYNCGYCKRAHAEVTALLEADTNIRWVVKEYPILSESSNFAAQAALAALSVGGSAKYIDFHNRLITSRSRLSEAAIRMFAEEAGLDWRAVAARMQSDAIRDMIQQNHRLADALGIQGTPAFVIGGKLIPGFVARSELAAAVQEARMTQH
jgi:protein-disulfide isomerase